MGPNGAGKTVLLSCLAGSREPMEGAVEVFGRPVGEDGGDSLTFLLQDSMAVGMLTGRENVDFSSRLHPHFTDRWREYVDRLGLAEDLDKRVGNYFEGMKRKLELALTMSVDVPVYLLDEPAAGVDLTNIQRFHDIILEARDAGKTVLVSSHRPIGANIADRVAFVPDGTDSTVSEPDGLMEQVPPVVRVTGNEAMRTAQEYVDGQLFPVGGEAQGFLAEDVAFEGLPGPSGVRASRASTRPTPTCSTTTSTSSHERTGPTPHERTGPTPDARRIMSGEIEPDDLREELETIKEAMGLQKRYSGATSMWLLFGLAVPVASALSQYVFTERLAPWLHAVVWAVVLGVGFAIWYAVAGKEEGEVGIGAGARPNRFVQFGLVYALGAYAVLTRT